ncbi:MAG: cytochrome c [Sphingobium sp.]|nr:cytochrome c [Sphingobium sp.]
MTVKYGWVALGGLLVFVAAARAASSEVFLLPLMKETVAPQAQVLWDVGNKALDDEGNASSARLTAADWAKLAGAAQKMKNAAASIASASKVVVAPAGMKLQDEGAPGQATARQIQAFIDANPKDFADHARALAEVSDGFLKAAASKDAKTLGNASARLDEVCEACHVKYWYPDQPK